MVVEQGALTYGGILFVKYLYDKWRGHRFGVYGIWGTGKTTLDRYLSTPGEFEDELDPAAATRHPYNKRTGQYVAPLPTRKKVRYRINERVVVRTVVSNDIGGQVMFQNLWLRDMVERDVEVVIFLIDHRHLNDPSNSDQQDAFSHFVHAIVHNAYGFRERRMKRRGKRYRPRLVALIANKTDEWLEHDEDWLEAWRDDRMDRHPIFDPFRRDMAHLRRAGIPNIKRCISALRGHDVEETIFDCIQHKV